MFGGQLASQMCPVYMYMCKCGYSGTKVITCTNYMYRREPGDEASVHVVHIVPIVPQKLLPLSD